MSDPDQDLDAFTRELIEHMARPISAMEMAIMDLRGGRMVGPLQSARDEALRTGRIVEGYAVRWDANDGQQFAADIGFDRDPKKARKTLEYLRRKFPEKGPYSLVQVQLRVGPAMTDAEIEEHCEVQTWLARREQEILRERHPEGMTG